MAWTMKKKKKLWDKGTIKYVMCLTKLREQPIIYVSQHCL